MGLTHRTSRSLLRIPGRRHQLARAGSPAYFGNDAVEREQRTSTEGLKKVNIPLFVSRTEVDLPTSIEQAEVLNKMLCDAGRCPTYMVFKDHGHLSQGYSIGTTDTSVSGPILEVLRKVK
jgi:triacylglycerol lipase